MFYLTTHSTHFIYGYMASDIWLRIVRKETRCRHIGYSYRLTARVLLYAPSHRQDNTYHGLCYTSCGALAGTRKSSMGPSHEGSIRRPHHTISERSTSELRPAPCFKASEKRNASLRNQVSCLCIFTYYYYCSCCFYPYYIFIYIYILLLFFITIFIFFIVCFHRGKVHAHYHSYVTGICQG